MTKDEILQNTNMTDVLSEYDIAVYRGMCRCPFHDDKRPSMKVHKDGVTCFTCGQTWDLFGFVMKMDNCDFKTAFKRLGGSYNNQLDARQRLIAKAKRDAEKAARERIRMTNAKIQRALWIALTICQNADLYEPYSDEWVELKNHLPVIEYMYDERVIKGNCNEWSDIDVFRECESIRQRYLVQPGDLR